jgi:hypothetical protein
MGMNAGHAGHHNIENNKVDAMLRQHGERVWAG